VSGDPDLPEILVVVDGFKAAGMTSEPDVIPDSLSSTDKSERRARSHSVTRSAGLDPSYWDRFLTTEVSTQENRWRGSNTGGYSNPSFEALFGQWRTLLDANPRLEKEAELHKLLADELAYLPLFYNVDVFAFRKSLVGPKANTSEGRNVSVDIHTWRFTS
jgi:ABC-type transport system substrate-binding protein